MLLGVAVLPVSVLLSLLALTFLRALGENAFGKKYIRNSVFSYSNSKTLEIDAGSQPSAQHAPAAES